MTAGNIRDKVFISYSHKDKEWLESIQSMLSPRFQRMNPFCGLTRKLSLAIFGELKSQERLIKQK